MVCTEANSGYINVRVLFYKIIRRKSSTLFDVDSRYANGERAFPRVEILLCTDSGCLSHTWSMAVTFRITPLLILRCAWGQCLDSSRYHSKIEAVSCREIAAHTAMRGLI